MDYVLYFQHRERDAVLLFCPRCFASSRDGSWGGKAEKDFCCNCSTIGSMVRLPLWAVESIRQQASWVGNGITHMMRTLSQGRKYGLCDNLHH
jgi:hypothetical protein